VLTRQTFARSFAQQNIAMVSGVVFIYEDSERLRKRSRNRVAILS
jgi:hypothetical protein